MKRLIFVFILILQFAIGYGQGFPLSNSDVFSQTLPVYNPDLLDTRFEGLLIYPHDVSNNLTSRVQWETAAGFYAIEPYDGNSLLTQLELVSGTLYSTAYLNFAGPDTMCYRGGERWVTSYKWLDSDCTSCSYSEAEWVSGVDVKDLIALVRHLEGVTPFTTARQFIAADVNIDGLVNAVDISLMQQLILGTISEFPNANPYQNLTYSCYYENGNRTGIRYVESVCNQPHVYLSNLLYEHMDYLAKYPNDNRDIFNFLSGVSPDDCAHFDQLGGDGTSYEICWCHCPNASGYSAGGGEESFDLWEFGCNYVFTVAIKRGDINFSWEPPIQDANVPLILPDTLIRVRDSIASLFSIDSTQVDLLDLGFDDNDELGIAFMYDLDDDGRWRMGYIANFLDGFPNNIDPPTEVQIIYDGTLTQIILDSAVLVGTTIENIYYPSYSEFKGSADVDRTNIYQIIIGADDGAPNFGVEDDIDGI